MAKVVITRDDDGSGDWLAEGDIGESAYYANAATLSELEAMIQEAGELIGVDPEVVIAPEAATA
ncbi:MAG: hypothetical protein OXG34_04840 [bacterium]|nr:hypothetical protein [bacterium]MCY3890755.1 hypothetical protein [bacterium]MCY3960978.1 hypothetical protein [bacterium]MCY4133966.1 hypothetical protein [bacterium]